MSTDPKSSSETTSPDNSAPVGSESSGSESDQGVSNNAVQDEPDFRVVTDQFRGPADLLLYLVRRHEVEISDIALARVTQQFLEFIEVLKEIDIDMVGDFVEVGSLLVELKARAVLPRNEHETDSPDHDPREDLIQRLLMYKQFKDAANLLEDRAASWQNRFARISDDAPPRTDNMLDQPIKEVELWDLVSAFGRVLRDNRPAARANIVYDDTPIQTYMMRIHSQLVDREQVLFSELFLPGMHKSAMVGVFLAVLELSRYHNVSTEQSELHSDILIKPSDGFIELLDVSKVDNYDPHAGESGADPEPEASGKTDEGVTEPDGRQ